MDPYYEQRLRDEVLYLHSLWHQGPPNPNPNHLHSLRQQGPSRPPNPNNTNNTTSTQFKEPKKPKKKKAKETPPPPPQSDIEWPCNETPASGAARPSWPAPVPAPAPTTRVLTPQEQAQFAATRVQNKAVAAVKAFFACDSDSDDSDGDKEVMGEDGSEEYQFFMRLFAEEEELEEYCEENWEGGGGGGFVCLVCGGVGKIKRFKNLVAVVQHSVTIARTKRKNAHRAYAQVVCRVLGWDVDRLPTVDSKPLGNAEVAVGELRMINQDLALANVCNGKTIQKEVFDVDQEEKIPSSSNGETIQKEVFDVDQEEEIPSSSISGISNVIGDNVMLCEKSVKDVDATKCLEKFDQGPPNPNSNQPNLTTSTQFKEPKKPKKKKAKKTPHQSDLEWPCNETPMAGAACLGWPAPVPAPTSQVLTLEEQAQFATTQVQNNAVATVEAFFACHLASDDSDGDKGVMGEDGYEEYQFFMKLFAEEEELMEYCEENWEGGGGGGFVCLVCGGIGKSKSFKNLVAVVQHSVTVLRTKRKNAHRAYAQVVCRILGWDVDRLPTIDSKPQNSVKDGDANSCLEMLDNEVQSFGDGDTAGVVTCLEHSEDNGVGNEIRDYQKAIVVVNERKENNGEVHRVGGCTDGGAGNESQ